MYTLPIQDLYNTSGFRDLILHVSERRFTLPEISSMLTDEGLSFRGFFDEHAFDKFKQRFPDETWPGRLERWDDFENQNPNHFVGMYYFWCDKSRSEQMHSLAT